MPANTPLGYPYPLPTEPVAEGAQAIRNLAEALGTVVVPHCRVYRSAVQGIAHLAETAVIWEAESYDSHGMWAVGDPTKIVCKSPGLYAISAYCEFVAHGGGNYRLARLRLNGGATYFAKCMSPTSGTTASIGLNIVTIVRLALNDFLQLNVLQDSGAQVNLTAGGPEWPFFDAYLISP